MALKNDILHSPSECKMALKNDILEILENNRTKDVSGQELAERLRVTRAAVWKAVKVLKADGHSIEAVRNRGYRLSDESDIISREGIKSELKHSCDVMVYRCVDSTNTTAKLAAVEIGRASCRERVSSPV